MTREKKKTKHVVIQSMPPKDHVPTPEELGLGPLITTRKEDLGTPENIARPAFRKKVKEGEESKEQFDWKTFLLGGLFLKGKKKEK